MAKKQHKNGDTERVPIKLQMSRRLSAAVNGAAESADESLTEFICRTLAERVKLADWKAPDRRGRPALK